MQVVVLATLAAGPGCGRKDNARPGPLPRPVTVLELRGTAPKTNLRLIGSVEPWKEEDRAFEVRGPVEWVIDEGQDVEGPQTGPDGEALSEGTVLARLDTTPYELAIATAEAEAAKLEAQMAAARIELDEILPQKLAAAEAHHDQVKKDLDHLKRLVKLEAGSATEYYREEALYRMSQAAIQELEATAVAKRAELGVLQATQRHAQEKLEQTRKDLANCTLVSRFEGIVSAVHMDAGGFAQPGQAVVTVTMMDPLKVDVAVSSANDGVISYKDTVNVYPPGSNEPQAAPVWRKEVVADPATHAFKVTMLVRNTKVSPSPPAGSEFEALPRIEEIWPILAEDVGDPSSKRVTEASAICTDPQSGSHYVWQVESRRRLPEAGPDTAVLRLRRVPVRVGGRVPSVVGPFRFTELTDTGGLDTTATVASGVPEGVKDGDRVLFAPRRWLFRPGDLVDVVLEQPAPAPGYYVPPHAILPVDETTGYVFVVEEGKVAKIEVELTAMFGELRGIKSKAPEDEGRITDGAQLILKGIRYLVPGEPVRALE